MIGFLGSVSDNVKFDFSTFNYFENSLCLSDQFSSNNFKICRKLNSKFKNDKVFSDDENFFIGVDGVILNIRELRNTYSKTNNFQLLSYLAKSEGKEFVNLLKGDFSLICYDKVNKKLYIYTNLTTSKPIYYHYDKRNQELYFGSNSFHLSELLKHNGISLTPNIFAFYSVTSFGYVYGNHHFSNEIKKLRGGQFISFDGSLEVKDYFELRSFPQIETNEQKLIHQIDERFKKAISYQFDKDLEYGYNHLSTLSGGLDSRMTTLVAQDLGYKEITTLTFSSKGYLDEFIAKRIAKDFNLDSLFLSMTSGNYLMDYEFGLNLNGGLLSYFVASQMVKLYDQVDFKNFGMIHTGQVGDAIIGNTIFKHLTHFRYGYPNPQYANVYREQLEEEVRKEHKKNETFEVSKFKNHVYNYTLEGNQYIYPHTESCSPFLDRDFMQYCLRIPLKYRNKHNLYYKWIKNYHPYAGKYFYEKTKQKTIGYNNKYLDKLYAMFYLKFNKLYGLKAKNNALLDFNNWWKSTELKNYIEIEFNKKIELINNQTLKDDLIRQFGSTSFKTKMKAFHTVLTYELYFTK